MPIDSSTTQGVFTWPDSWNSLVPSFFGLPMLANHSGAAAQDGRDDRDDLDIVDRRRAAVEARARREWRLQPRLALLALEAFEHRRFFAADVGAGAAVDEQVEVVAACRRRSCRSAPLHKPRQRRGVTPRFRWMNSPRM